MGSDPQQTLFYEIQKKSSFCFNFRARSRRERTEAEGAGRRGWVGSRRTVGLVPPARRLTARLISQHSGFLNAGARACACTHRRALGLARAHGALAQSRHLPLPLRGYQRPSRKRAEQVRGKKEGSNDCSQSTVGKNGQDYLREPPKY